MKNTVSIFNGLNGANVERELIEKLITAATREEQLILVSRLQKVIDENPDHNVFKFEIDSPAIEQVPQSLVDTAIFIDDINEPTGLNKPVSQNEIFDTINELIINTIKKVGHLPWQKEWVGSGAEGVAKNYKTKQPYSGINHILLNFDVKFDSDDQPYLVPITFIQPYYLTFNQIKEAKAKLIEGSKARNVIYYTPLFTYNDGTLEIKTSDVKKWKEFLTTNNITDELLRVHSSRIPIVKYYNVYKADDCTGLKFPKAIANKKVDPIEQAQAIIDGYPNPPKFTFVGDKAAYFPLKDVVNMPKIEAFNKESFYYSTFFHELIHSTGHSKRLNRGNDTRKRDGSKEDKKAYAFEELVAELGAVFLCSEAGILFHTLENSAKYLKGWNDNLIENLKDDNRMFFKASAAAQKGATLILSDQEAKPKVEKEVEKPVEKGVKNTRIIEKFKTSAKASKIRVLRKNKQAITVKKTEKTAPVFKKDDHSKTETTNSTGLLPDYSKPTVTKKVVRKKTVVNNQLGLFGAKKQIKIKQNPHTSTETRKKAENAVKKLLENKADINPISSHAPQSNRQSIATRKLNAPAGPVEYFQIDDLHISNWLGMIERKNKESVVVTLTGEQGSMKTRLAFRLMNAFAQKYHVGHASIEEHPGSVLYDDKVEEYLNQTAQNNIDNPEIKSLDDLHRLIENNDVIFIDSFQKLRELDKSIEIDKDLRKKYDGKLFIVIFQQTSDGKMRGGSTSQFDADIVAFTEKMPSYHDMYGWFDKNRYQRKDLSNLHYNIFTGTIKTQETEQEGPGEVPPVQVQEPINFSFNVN